MPTIRNEVLEAVSHKFHNKGDSFRLRHSKKMNGDLCTPPDGDPAMVVTRGSDKWLFICHRCKEFGSIPDTTMSPKDTIEKIKRNAPLIDKEVDTVYLPSDYKLMTYDAKSKVSTWSGFQWLWKYGINNDLSIKHEIGWSDRFKRVIIPIWEYTTINGKEIRKLVGWVGRDPVTRSKEVRKKENIPKYFNCMMKGKRRYFTVKGMLNLWVVCEDCLSAIKVNEATGFNTIALLNATIGDDLIKLLKGKRVFVWLDPNMKSESIKYVARMCQLGVKAVHIGTDCDPKEHPVLYIKDKLTGKSNETKTNCN